MKARTLKARTGRRAANPSVLPIPFLLAAECALISSGTDPSVPARLRDALAFAQPILTLDNLANRTRDLLGAAWDYGDKVGSTDSLTKMLQAIAQRGAVDADDHTNVRLRVTEDGLYIGLVAGYLLAQMMNGQGDAR